MLQEGYTMKKFTNKSLCFILSILMVFSVIMLPSFKSKAEVVTIDDFVERCYTVTLGRGSDADGFEYWKNQLLNGESVGENIAYGFLFSPEYLEKNKSPEDYVTDLYHLFMGREPDEDGYNYWLNQLEEGKSREEIFAGFANSREFYEICDSYGITAGWFVVGSDRNQVNNVNRFVERLYKICLGRRGDLGGQKNWVEKLIKKEITGSECARSFVQSPEYEKNGLSDDDYVENLYLCMMGRASDEAGKEYWIRAIRVEDRTRDQVFEGFANSEEFENICNTYNIEKGTYTATKRSGLKTYEVVVDKEMLDLINSYRAENGLSELAWNAEAEQIAKDRIRAIAEGGELSHSAAGGPPEGCCAENLFGGSGGGKSSEFIFNGYKTSEWHDANMKKPSATSCVIATCNVFKDFGGTKVYWGQWNIQIFY